MLVQPSRKAPRRPLRGGLGDDLAERIRGQVECRASGRIRDLVVICSEGRIVLRGRSRTYHAKQLAQEAALDLADGCHDLTNQIEVG